MAVGRLGPHVGPGVDAGFTAVDMRLPAVRCRLAAVATALAARSTAVKTKDSPPIAFPWVREGQGGSIFSFK